VTNPTLAPDSLSNLKSLVGKITYEIRLETGAFGEGTLPASSDDLSRSGRSGWACRYRNGGRRRKKFWRSCRLRLAISWKSFLTLVGKRLPT